MQLGRRGALRLLSLSALAAAATPSLAACGGSAGPGGDTAGLELVSSDIGRAAGDSGAVPAVITGLHDLGGGVLGALPSTGNLAISPYSIGVATALVANGARGETLSQLTGLLGGTDIATINGGLDALTADVDALAGSVERRDGSSADIDLDTANGLFGQRGEAWQSAFLDALARSYGAGLQDVDFEGDAAGAVAAVNDWTAQRTGGRITDIVSTGVVDADTRLVLVDALYLKAPWETPFDRINTKDTPFTRPDGSIVTVSMMAFDEATSVPYAAGDGWAAGSFTYAGGTLAMTVVLPDVDRFDEVEADVVAGHLPRYLAALEADQIDVGVPRWTFRTAVSLVDPLRTLGVTDVFDDRADLSAMTTQDELYLSAVQHQVFIAVDEDGTEAAAATAEVAEASSLSISRTSLFLDRPFLFVIHDVEHGTPLFLGRVTDPTTT